MLCINNAKATLQNYGLSYFIIFQALSFRNFFVRSLTVPLDPQLATNSFALIPKAKDNLDKVKPSPNLGKGLKFLIDRLRSLSISSKVKDS